VASDPAEASAAAELRGFVRQGRAAEARLRLEAELRGADGEVEGALRAASVLLNRLPSPKGRITADALRPLLGGAAATDTLQRLAVVLESIQGSPLEEAPRIEAACLLLHLEEVWWAEQAMLPLWRAPEPGALFARVLSGIWSVLGRADGARDAAELAVQCDPRMVEYQVHLAAVLLQQGAYAAALLAAGRAIGLAPDDATAWRIAAAAALSLGDAEQAIAASRRAAQLSSAHDGFAEQVVVSVAAEGLRRGRGPGASGWTAPPKPSWAVPPETLPPSPPTRLAMFFRARLRVIDALMLREARTQFSHSRIGYAWALFEPMMHVFILFVAIGLFGAHHAPIGDSLPLFYMTGVLPYLFFAHVTERGVGLARELRPMLAVPVIMVSDIVIARLLLRAATDMLVFIAAVGIFFALDLGHLPHEPFAIVCAYLVLFSLAVGFALINMVLSIYSDIPERIWGFLIRALYFVSGIFYHPSMVPAGFREWMLWNPLVHAIEWVRQAYYPFYISPYLDVEYLLRFALGMVLVGCLAAAGSRHRLRATH
jgi:ABC-type polysaccharide/polyol phosphate export permease